MYNKSESWCSMEFKNDLELIEDIELAIKLLKNKNVLFSNHLGNKTFFVEKRKRVLIKATNSTYYLSYDEFKDLYENCKFIVYEEKEENFDFSRDDEYYSWKHK